MLIATLGPCFRNRRQYLNVSTVGTDGIEMRNEWVVQSHESL